MGHQSLEYPCHYHLMPEGHEDRFGGTNHRRKWREREVESKGRVKSNVRAKAGCCSARSMKRSP